MIGGLSGRELLALIRIFVSLGGGGRIMETRILRWRCRNQEKRYHRTLRERTGQDAYAGLQDGLNLLQRQGSNGLSYSVRHQTEFRIFGWDEAKPE
jgi:hypothetical protein